MFSQAQFERLVRLIPESFAPPVIDEVEEQEEQETEAEAEVEVAVEDKVSSSNDEQDATKQSSIDTFVDLLREHEADDTTPVDVETSAMAAVAAAEAKEQKDVEEAKACADALVLAAHKDKTLDDTFETLLRWCLNDIEDARRIKNWCKFQVCETVHGGARFNRRLMTDKIIQAFRQAQPLLQIDELHDYWLLIKWGPVKEDELIDYEQPSLTDGSMVSSSTNLSLCSSLAPPPPPPLLPPMVVVAGTAPAVSAARTHTGTGTGAVRKRQSLMAHVERFYSIVQSQQERKRQMDDQLHQQQQEQQKQHPTEVLPSALARLSLAPRASSILASPTTTIPIQQQQQQQQQSSSPLSLPLPLSSPLLPHAQPQLQPMPSVMYPPPLPIYWQPQQQQQQPPPQLSNPSLSHTQFHHQQQQQHYSIANAPTHSFFQPTSQQQPQQHPPLTPSWFPPPSQQQQPQPLAFVGPIPTYQDYLAYVSAVQYQQRQMQMQQPMFYSTTQQPLPPPPPQQ
jgi:hypothetical protein